MTIHITESNLNKEALQKAFANKQGFSWDESSSIVRKFMIKEMARFINARNEVA